MFVPELGVNQQQIKGTTEILTGDRAREGMLLGKAGLDPQGGPQYWLGHSCPTRGDPQGDTGLPGMAPLLQRGRCY